VATRLVGVDAGAPFVQPANIGRPSSFAVNTQRWEAATAGGRTSLLSTEQQRAFARVYKSLALLDRYQNEERSVWAELRVLEGIKSPPPERLYDLRVALVKARDLDARSSSSIIQSRFFAAKIGVKGDAKLQDPPGAPASSPDALAATSICQPFGTAPGKT
jgi:hypothetical protein